MRTRYSDDQEAVDEAFAAFFENEATSTGLEPSVKEMSGRVQELVEAVESWRSEKETGEGSEEENEQRVEEH